MRNHKRLKRRLAAITLAFCFLLSGCSTAAAMAPSQTSGPVGSSVGSTAPSSSQMAKPAGKPVVKMMIPSSQQALGDLLSQLAKEQNMDLQLLVGANEPRYTLELAEALAGEEPPELYWLAGEFSARVLAQAEQTPRKLSEEKDVALATLAQITPAEMRILGSEAVYGLPLGVYAEGTIVNIETLAALLGSQDLATLQRDLIDCSYKEWKTMQQAVAKYLEKPSRYQFRLGSGVYTMPNYRPPEAEKLRGLWALATVGNAAYTQNGLSAVFSAAYADPADYLDSDPDETSLFLEEPLQALVDEMEFETLHMASEGGALARGDNFALAGEVTSEVAKKLFAEGTALFWKGDTRQALMLETEQPQLQDALFLIPTKMPFENQEVALLNNLYSVGVEGYLCLPGKTTPSDAAKGLLLQLYTAPAWRSAMEEQLHILPYTSLFPSRSLLAGLEEIVGLGEYYLHPLEQRRLSTAQQRAGEWLNLNLMAKAEWSEEDKANLLTAMQAMLGELNLQAEEE